MTDPNQSTPWISPTREGDHIHASCYAWVRGVVANHNLAGRSTIEIGSALVNYGTIRDFFTGSYTGVDISPGEGVDRIENCEHLSDGSNYWANVVSLETLEHVRRPWVAVREMARVGQHDAHILVSARGYDNRGCWQVHGYPDDYWRVSEGAMRVMAEDAGLEVIEISADPEGPGFFMHCQKP